MLFDNIVGEEILDNYGYHYAVMSKEERQRKLQSQYFFSCGCQCCRDNWPVYTGLSTSAVPVPGTQPDQVTTSHDQYQTNNHHSQAKQIISEFNKSSKQYKKAFDLVLSGKFR